MFKNSASFLGHTVSTYRVYIYAYIYILISLSRDTMYFRHVSDMQCCNRYDKVLSLLSRLTLEPMIDL